MFLVGFSMGTKYIIFLNNNLFYFPFLVIGPVAAGKF